MREEENAYDVSLTMLTHSSALRSEVSRVREVFPSHIHYHNFNDYLTKVTVTTTPNGAIVHYLLYHCSYTV